ncbi:hypothetical protein V6N12_035688 [Hibiscus sabdariffa]|uniref:NB-ARC domain-containing protein n=1 Tax=Hibiscus sabdariffa TaxID=183260 RepID=A0ABR2ENF2_9ROSI
MAEFAASAAANTVGNLKYRVKNDVDVAIRQAKVIEKDVEKWLTKAEKELRETQILEDEIDRIKCSKWCPNWGWRCCLSKKLVKKTLVVTKLLETRKITPVGRRVPLQGIEFITSEYFNDSESSKSALKAITEAVNARHVNKIGLYGMPGVGKTNLAKEFGKHALEQNLFDKVVMFTMSQYPNINKIQDKVADVIGLKFETSSEEGKAEELFLRMKGEKDILIIVDDLWEEIKLETIGIPLGFEHESSKILLTTRDQKVCTVMNCQKQIQLGLLSEEEGWVLFKANAGLEDGYSTLNGLAKEVAGECKGLPLAIVTVAKALKGESFDGWRAANQRLKDSRHLDNEDVFGGVYRALKLSYDYLKKNNQGASTRLVDLGTQRKPSCLRPHSATRLTPITVTHGFRTLRIENLSSSLSAFKNLFYNLRLEEVSGQKNIFPSTSKNGVNELTSHQLKRCDEWETLLFINLTFLNLKSLPDLESIFELEPSSHAIASLQNLKVVRIEECNKLKVIFSHALALNMLHLKQLYIYNCSGLEQVIGFAQEEITENQDCIIVGNHEQVFRVQGGDSFSNIKELHLGYLSKVRNIWKDLAGVVTLDKPYNSVLLTCLDIRGCEELEGTILGKDQVSSSSNVDTTLQPISFPYLNEIIVADCNNLKSLFPLGSAIALQKLAQLVIERNSKLEQVFEVEDEAQMTTNKEIKFDKLERLMLGGLPCLTDFCPKGYHFVFPGLGSLTVDECPKMTTSFFIDSKQIVHSKTECFMKKTEGSAWETTLDASYDKDIWWERGCLGTLPHYIEG